MSKFWIVVGLGLSTLIVVALLAASCATGPATPAPTPTVETVDDDSCWSVEELIERDEDCGYGTKSASPKPKVTKTTAPAKASVTPGTKSTRR